MDRAGFDDGEVGPEIEMRAPYCWGVPRSLGEHDLAILYAVRRSQQDGTDANVAARAAVPLLTKERYAEAVAMLIDEGRLDGVCQRTAAGAIGVLFVERVASAGLAALDDAIESPAASTQDTIDRLADLRTAAVESFFLAQGLGDAFRAPNPGWGKRKRINAALAVAESQGRLGEVLASARAHFAFVDSSGAAGPPAGSPPSAPTSPITGHQRGPSAASPDRRRVFLVHGRNQVAADALTDLLGVAGLVVVSWEEAVRAAGGGSPYTLDIVRSGMGLAQATVVLFTPDDVGCLDPRLIDPGASEPDDGRPTGRARQNVVLEAGMALAYDDRKVVLAELGRVAEISNLAGKHVVRLDGTPARRKALLQRLRDLGCEVNMDGERWIGAGDFTNAILSPIDYTLAPVEWKSSGVDAARGAAASTAAAGPVPNPLDGFHPSGSTAPSGGAVDLILRCAVLLPSAVGGPASTEETLSSLRGEERESCLADLLEVSDLTRWMQQQAEPFHVASAFQWEPHGYNAGDVSELAVEPTREDGHAGPLSAACRVQTGWIRPHGSSDHSRHGLLLIADLMLGILEYDEARQPSPIRHETSPPPAPAALSVGEALDALVAVMGLVDVARDAFSALLPTDPAPGDGQLTCWLSAAGHGLDRMIDMSAFRVIPKSGASSETRIHHALPLGVDPATWAPPDARRNLGRELLRGLLERSGRRGYADELAQL